MQESQVKIIHKPVCTKVPLAIGLHSMTVILDRAIIEIEDENNRMLENLMGKSYRQYKLPTETKGVAVEERIHRLQFKEVHTILSKYKPNLSNLDPDGGKVYLVVPHYLIQLPHLNALVLISKSAFERDWRFTSI